MSVFLNIVPWDPVDFPYVGLGCKHKHILSIRRLWGGTSIQDAVVRLKKKLASVKKKKRCSSLPSLPLVWTMLATRRCIIPPHANPENPPSPLGSRPSKIEPLRTTCAPPNTSQIEDKQIYYAKLWKRMGFPPYIGCNNYRDV